MKVFVACLVALVIVVEILRYGEDFPLRSRIIWWIMVALALGSVVLLLKALSL